MKKFLVSAFALLASTIAMAADKPNFSGEWKLNIEKSDYGTIPHPDALVRTIKHEGSSLAVSDKQTGGYGGDSSSSRNLTIDGQTHKIINKNAEAESTVDWVDNKVHSVTEVKAAQLTYDETIVLSADGKMMTSTVEINSPRGGVEIVMVFDRT